MTDTLRGLVLQPTITQALSQSHRVDTTTRGKEVATMTKEAPKAKTETPFKIMYFSGPTVMVIGFKDKGSGMKWEAEVGAIKQFIANINASAEMGAITISQKDTLYRQWVDHVLATGIAMV